MGSSLIVNSKSGCYQVQTLEFLVVATMTVLCCIAMFSLFSLSLQANVGWNTQVHRNYTTPHKTQMIDTTINLLVNWMECTNRSGTTLNVVEVGCEE